MEEDFYRGQLSPLFQSGSHKINPPGKEKESLANMKTTTPHVSNSTSHSSRDCRPVAGLLIPLVLVCFALLPRAQAVLPAPDGGYPNGNTAEGSNALLNFFNAGYNGYNTAVGLNALLNNTTGSRNIANGANALRSNISGNNNTAIGTNTLFLNTMGGDNTATGYQALFSNIAGSANTANGFQALFRNSIGANNTATGFQALLSNRTGFANTANGTSALINNTTGGGNTATGFLALGFNGTGINNTATGRDALFHNQTGSNNTAVGQSAGFSITGTGNVCIGQGVSGVAGENDTTWIRNVNTTVQPVAAGVDAVTVRLSDGRLGHPVSSRRYKEDIKPMDKASEALYQLKPVTYRYKKDIDSSQSLDYGLLAEDVAKINPELAIRDGNGQIESVRYNAVKAMLLNEFLKQHRKVEEQNRKIEEQEATISQLKSAAAKQEASIAQQQKGMEAIAARLQEQESQIQKVSAQLEVKKPAPRTVLNDQ